jgi:crotonobetainyl-CoA:carnitine CoA-transferase CaiB-like acyl-CoA transferase
MVPLLRGIRLLELSSVVMGPLAGQILADLGAEVVKLEPVEGDVARGALPRSGDISALYASNNRNKRVVAADLKSAAGQAIAHRLIARSDALLVNMRPVAAQRLGLGYDEAAKINPDIVYCAVIGYGERGPYRGRPAFDDVIQAATALADLGRREGEAPRFVPTILADKIGALHAAYAMLAALTAKARGQDGAMYVEVPMFEALAATVLNEHLAGATFEADGELGYSRVLSQDRRPFQTQDGWMAVLPYTHDQWRRFLLEIDRADLVAQPWFQSAMGRSAHIDELYAAVSQGLRGRSNAVWSEALLRLDIPFSPVTGLSDLLVDPHLAAIGFFEPGPAYPPNIKRSLGQPIHFGTQSTVPDQPPRRLGADTRDILRECGYVDHEIEAMAKRGDILL